MNETNKKMDTTKTFTIITPFCNPSSNNKELISQFELLRKWRDEIIEGEEWKTGKFGIIAYPLNFIFTLNDLKETNQATIQEINPEGNIDKLYFPSSESRQEYYDFLTTEIIEYKTLLAKNIAVCDAENNPNQNWTWGGEGINEEDWNEFAWTLKNLKN